MEHTGLTVKTVSKSVFLFRQLLRHGVEALNVDEWLGAATNTCVCVDETYGTQRKRNVAGFAGRETAGHKTCILGMIELDLTTRECTGRTFLTVISVPTRVAIEGEIRKRVFPGATI